VVRLIFIIALNYFSIALLAGSFQQVNAQEKDVAAQEKKADENTESIDEEKAEETGSEAPLVIMVDRSKIKMSDPVDHLKQKKDDLKHYLNQAQITPILAGAEDHLTLISTNTTPNNKGVMILVPDWQQSASTPKALNYLYEMLPDQGWTTIKVQPPNKPKNYPSVGLNQTERDEENNKSLEDYQKKLSLIIQAVTEKATNYPGIIVVVAEGSNASILINIYEQSNNEKPVALVMLSSHLNDDKNNLQTAINLSQLDLPVLDLYLKRDHPLVKSNSLLRKKYVNQEFKANYRQQQLNNITSSYYPKAKLLKTINGWLKSTGW